MVGWATIVLGAGLSALAALIGLLGVVRPRDNRRIVVGAVAAGLGPLAWNAVLHTAEAPGFFTDAPIRAFPASWQDAGSGVWALGAVVLALGLGPARSLPAHRVLTLALGCAIAAFLVDVYLY